MPSAQIGSPLVVKKERKRWEKVIKKIQKYNTTIEDLEDKRKSIEQDIKDLIDDKQKAKESIKEIEKSIQNEKQKIEQEKQKIKSILYNQTN